MKLVGILLLIIGITFLTLFLYTWYRLHMKLHFHAQSSQMPMPTGLSATTEFVTTSDNQKIAYWYFPVRNPKAVVILIHGYSNPGGKAQMLEHVEYLHANGYSTAALDLRSFGESEGAMISLGTQEWKDVDALYDHLHALPENKNKKIGFLGISMGASTAIVTAGKTGKGDFVIASVPFYDIDSLYHFQIQAAGFPPNIFHPLMKLAGSLELGSDYPQSVPSRVINQIHVPILLIGANQDQEVQPQDAKRLYDKANEPKELWQVESEHDIFYFHPEEFTKKVLTFLEKNIK